MKPGLFRWVALLLALNVSLGLSATPPAKASQTAVMIGTEAIKITADTNSFLKYKTVFRPLEQEGAAYNYEERVLAGTGKVSVVSLSPASALMTGYRVTESEAGHFFQSLVDAGVFDLPVRWSALEDPLLRKVPIRAPFTQSPDFAPGYELELQLGGKRLKTAFPVYDRPAFPPSAASKVIKLIEAFFIEMDARAGKEHGLQDLYRETLNGPKPLISDLSEIRSGLRSHELTNRIVSAARLSLLADQTNVVRECISILDDPDERVRMAAKAGLEKTGTNAIAATPLLSNLLRRHSRDSIRLLAAGELRRGDPQDATIRDVLLDGMKDQNADVRQACAGALTKFKFQSPEHWEKWHSLLISHEYRTNAAVLKLLPLDWTNNVPPALREQLTGDLLKLLMNDTEEIRTLAVGGLHPFIRSDSSVQSAVIERMQKDTAPNVRRAALWCVRDSLYDSPIFESLVVQAAADPVPEIKATALEILAGRSAGKALTDDMLLEAISSSDWRLRINAAWLLAQRKRPESVPVLLAEMEQYGNRRVNTAEYLAQFGPEVLPLLRPQLNSLKISTVKSLFSALALANIHEFGPDILAATRHTDPSMRAHALKALSWLKLDNADVRMACETLKNDPDETVRKEAEDCLAFLNQLKKRRRN